MPNFGCGSNIIYIPYIEKKTISMFGCTRSRIDSNSKSLIDCLRYAWMGLENTVPWNHSHGQYSMKQNAWHHIRQLFSNHQRSNSCWSIPVRLRAHVCLIVFYIIYSHLSTQNTILPLHSFKKTLSHCPKANNHPFLRFTNCPFYP